MQFPEGYLEAQAKKAAEKEAQKSDKKGKRKRKSDEEEETEDGSNTEGEISNHLLVKNATSCLIKYEQHKI